MRGFRVTRRPAFPTSLKWVGGNGSRARVARRLPHHAPGSVQLDSRLGGRGRGPRRRRRATGGAAVRRWICIWKLACLRQDGARRGFTGSRSRRRRHFRLDSGIARHASHGQWFRDNLRATGRAADAPWGCHRGGPRSRTVGPCAPFGRRRDRNCSGAFTAGTRARIRGHRRRRDATRWRARGPNAALGQDSWPPPRCHRQGKPGVGC